jgi:hypothetical protein
MPTIRRRHDARALEFSVGVPAWVLESLDGVCVRPYRDPNQPPETAADYKKLRELIDRCAPESKRGKIPILSGEWGNASNIKGVSLETECVTIESVA